MRLGRTACGTYELALVAPLGSGAMRGRALSPHAFAATVDFACHRCPNMAPPASAPQARWFAEGRWFTINLCREGCCEVDVPGKGLAVVSAGDICVSHSTELPDEYRYPSGHYRGIEVFVNTDIAMEPAFSLLALHEPSLTDITRAAGFAAVLAHDDELAGHLERMADALGQHDDVQACYELLGLLLALGRRDLADAQPHVILTHAQMGIAHAAHDELEASLALPHDARRIAARLGVSAATLNNYFSRVYGTTVAAYLRRRRVEAAAELLAGGASVAEAAVQVGYANPSKFAAAFKHLMGSSPSDWKRRLP